MKQIDLEERVLRIEQRNKNVELDKMWETSVTRRLLIASLTYLVVVTYLLMIGNDRPFVNGLVPSIGFVLSTLVVSRARRMWEASVKIDKRGNNNDEK